jgi:hypothetical protein
MFVASRLCWTVSTVRRSDYVGRCPLSDVRSPRHPTTFVLFTEHACHTQHNTLIFHFPVCHTSVKSPCHNTPQIQVYHQEARLQPSVDRVNSLTSPDIMHNISGTVTCQGECTPRPASTISYPAPAPWVTQPPPGARNRSDRTHSFVSPPREGLQYLAYCTYFAATVLNAAQLLPLVSAPPGKWLDFRL